MATRGRKSTYTRPVSDAICERLAAGESLLRICSGEGMPPESTVRLWALDDTDGFAARYTRARDIGLDHVADEVIAIADERGADPHEKRVRFDARRWYLSKLAPKRYGDRLELAGDKDNPIQTRVLIEIVESPGDAVK